MGDINVFTGPMKCGKTQKILNELDRQLIAGKDIKVFKPSIDNRFGDNIIQTRSGKKIDAINIYTTNPIELLNSALRKVTRGKGILKPSAIKEGLIHLGLAGKFIKE